MACAILAVWPPTAHPAPSFSPLSLDTTVTEARDDLLLVEPLDLGPGAPATAALEVERGPQPTALRERGTP